ncbi:C-type LECtin [Caenorhabditis elegans]|uniref:C-type LECtin n=1 Tax=Caenorhabditis elegans TaxID=6239 RepID=O17166_CAEEL|nr:C-type LECtin [Caenorhabditis elegans]CCD61973.1 C-type LECtin [Caenorhabditis elegans]|eukprot:NP_494427.1 C-type LECtin [Caenorhabditis elegans]
MLFYFLLSLLQLTSASLPSVCTDGFTLVNGKCLMMFKDESNHDDAESFCRLFRGTLFDVKNAIDNRAVASFIGSQVETVWMGLFCFNNNLCLWDDNSGSTAAYDNFSGGYPEVTIGSCVYYATQGTLAGKWISADCTDRRSFVCETPTTHEDSCYYNYNNYCYTFHRDLYSFTTAQTICEEECGNLVSIHSANENRYVMTIASHTTQANVLIGGMWPMDHVNTWVDGTMWDYSNIDSGYDPTNHCIAMANNATSEYNLGQWFGVDCKDYYSFVCKRPAGVPCSTDQPKVTVTPVPSNESFCNSTVLMTPGIITSPNYPQNYDNNVYCSYKLSTLGSYNILLEFTSFSTEENVDLVTVYDGESTNGLKIGTYSGSREPFHLISKGNNFFLAFSTDSRNVFKGFSASFVAYST